MFDKVWKEQIVKPAGKVGIFKPKHGFDLEEENKDEKCCEEAKQKYIDWFVVEQLRSYPEDEEETKRRIERNYPNMSRNEIYEKHMPGIALGECEAFRDAITASFMRYDIIRKILKEWDECENV